MHIKKATIKEVAPKNRTKIVKLISVYEFGLC
jgi:hypothetical protein